MTITPSAIRHRWGRFTKAPDASYPPLPPQRALMWHLLLSRPKARLAVLLLCLMDIALVLAIPLIQRHIPDTLRTVAGTDGPALREALGWVLAVFLAMAAQTLLNTLVRLISARESAVAQSWLAQKLYGHWLNMDGRQYGRKSVGETVSLLAADIPSCVFVLEEVLGQMVTSVLTIVLAPFALVLTLGSTPWLPLSVTAVLFACTLWLARRQASFFARFKRLAAERMAIVNEWVQNIRIIRMLGWTLDLEARILSKRQEETANRVAMVSNGQTMSSVGTSAPYLVSAAGISGLILAKGTDLSPGEIFACLWILGVALVRPLRQVPFMITMVLDSLASARRVEEFFAMELEPSSAPGKKGLQKTGKGPSWKVENGCVERPLGGEPLLENIHLNIGEGAFVAVVGEVGSGKSVLLSSLAGELPIVSDNFEVDGIDVSQAPPDVFRLLAALVPQDGFVMNSTLRDNITVKYGSEKTRDEELLHALEICQFPLEERLFPNGLDTEIGERGVNLSGGQKQRLALARALWSEKTTILLDDCLSALDVLTESRILESLILGQWKQATRVLTTHRLTVLPHTDWIYFLQKGRVVAEGTWEHLLKTNLQFQEFVDAAKKNEATSK